MVSFVIVGASVVVVGVGTAAVVSPSIIVCGISLQMSQ